MIREIYFNIDEENIKKMVEYESKTKGFHNFN
jgi:hypothetical protein